MGGTIAGYSAFRIDNPIQLSGLQLEMFMRPGIAGVGFQVRGLHGRPYALQFSMCYINDATRNTAITNFNALRGTLITVVDDFDVTWYLLRVLDFQLVRKFNTGGAIYGGLSCDAWVEGRFTLMPTATSY